MYKHLLVATDGSELANRAIDASARLAHAVGAKLTVMYVAPTYHLPYYPDGVIVDWPDEVNFNKRVREAAERLLSSALERTRLTLTDSQSMVVQDDTADTAIIATAKTQGCDLIVLGSHGRSALGTLLLGSTTQRVLAHTDIHVLVVR
jgi:nucleotide-binding universal stress UspA family protein